MSDMDFPAAPLSPSLPSDFIDEDPTVRKRFLVTMQLSPGTDHRDPEAVAANTGRAELATPSPQKMRRAAVRESEIYKKYKRSMQYWVGQARTKKHDGDRAVADRKHRIAALLSVDSLVCFMIAFDYEDRCDVLLAGIPPETPPTRPIQTHSWSTLVPYLSKMSAHMESVDAEIAGLCHQVLGVIQLQMAYADRKTVEINPKECAQLLFSAISNFKRGLLLLPYQTVLKRYMLTPARGWDAPKINNERPDPTRNRACLPLHVNSSLAEAAAFSLQIGRKWAEMENIDYDWEAAKQQP